MADLSNADLASSAGINARLATPQYTRRVVPAPPAGPATVLRAATSADNAAILSDLRAVVRTEVHRQVAATYAATDGEPLTLARANVIHRLAMTYQLLEASTAREQAKYDLSGQSEEELAAAERAARQLLDGDGGT